MASTLSDSWPFLPCEVPVDDFFETYVEELGARGMQQDAPLAGTPVTSGRCLLSRGFPLRYCDPACTAHQACFWHLIGKTYGRAGHAGELDPVLEHFPHSGTQQMNGLVAPAVVHPSLLPGGGSFQDSMPAVPLEPLEPLHPMGNLVTSGFEAPLPQRSGSGSQVGWA